jgi:hypothetical protein
MATSTLPIFSPKNWRTLLTLWLFATCSCAHVFLPSSSDYSLGFVLIWLFSFEGGISVFSNFFLYNHNFLYTDFSYSLVGIFNHSRGCWSCVQEPVLPNAATYHTRGSDPSPELNQTWVLIDPVSQFCDAEKTWMAHQSKIVTQSSKRDTCIYTCVPSTNKWFGLL